MSYYTHFYTYDKCKQVDWAKQIIKERQALLTKELKNIPNDEFFKKQHEWNLEVVNDEAYAKFKEGCTKYNWKQDFIDEQEAWYQKYRRPDYTWEDDKREWVERLEMFKDTGLLTVLEDIPESELPDYVIDTEEILSSALINDINAFEHEIRDGKIYSGEEFKRYYRVKGRYCESMWFNDDGIIDMIEDYSDVRNEDGTWSNRVLTEEEKNEIHEWFEGHDDCYCWII